MPEPRTYHPPAATRVPAYEDFEQEELFREAARRATTSRDVRGDAPEEEDPTPPQGQGPLARYGVSMPTYDPGPMDQGPPREEDMDPEVFRELQRRYKATPRGSAERKSGIYEGEVGGKNYRYDEYGGRVKQGYIPDRNRGKVVNYLRFAAQEYTGVRERNQKQMSADAASRVEAQKAQQESKRFAATIHAQGAELILRARDMDQRRDEMQGRREDARIEGDLTMQDRASSRAMDRWREFQQQSDPKNVAATRLMDAQSEQLEAGNPQHGGKGASGKPPITMDAAMKQLATAEGELRAIDSELSVMQGTGKAWSKNPFTGFTSDEMADTKFHNQKGEVTRIVPGSEYNAAWQKLQKDRAYYSGQVQMLRRYSATGRWEEPGGIHDKLPTGGGPASHEENDVDPNVEDETDDDYITPGQAENSIILQKTYQSQVNPTGLLRGQTPTNAPPMRVGWGPDERSPIPPPEVLANLSFKEQVFYDLLSKNPQLNNRYAAQSAWRQSQGVVPDVEPEGDPRTGRTGAGVKR